MANNFDWGGFASTILETSPPHRPVMHIAARFTLPSFPVDWVSQISPVFNDHEIMSGAVRLGISVSTVRKKKVRRPEELDPAGLSIYRLVQRACPMPGDIAALFAHCNDRRRILSGRAIDFFITIFAKQNHTRYFLLPRKDAWGYTAFSLSEQPGYVAFDVYTSYETMLRTYSKTYFDVFNRGATVLHEGAALSLPQSMFFLWCRKHFVLDYIRAYIGGGEHNTRAVKRKMTAAHSTPPPSKKPTPMVETSALDMNQPLPYPLYIMRSVGAVSAPPPYYFTPIYSASATWCADTVERHIILPIVYHKNPHAGGGG